jgi:nucleoside-diphosphate-sugar epimerase
VIAVLGAGGYLGAATVAALAAGPEPVRAVARDHGPLPAGVEAVTADLTAPGEPARAVAGCRAVVNLAARIDGPGTWRVAEGDTAADRVNGDLPAELVRLLAARAEPAVLVLAGSATQDAGTGPYDRQKRAAERLLLATPGVRGVALRLPTITGLSPGPAGIGRGVLAAMVRRAVAGEPLVLWGDGAVRRDFLDVADTAAAIAAAVRHADRLGGRPWPLGTGAGIPLRSAFALVAGTVAGLTGRPPVPLRSVPPPAEATATDGQDTVVDPAAFRARTGWAAVVPLAGSVRRMAHAAATTSSGSR